MRTVLGLLCACLALSSVAHAAAGARIRPSQIRAALEGVPAGDRRGVVATIMVGTGVDAAKIRAAVESVPPAWGEQRLLMGTIMAAMKVPYEKVSTQHASVPREAWPRQRGVLSAIMAATGLTYRQIEAQERTIPRGRWAAGQQRVVVAALEAAFHVDHAQVAAAAAKLPPRLYPGQRAIIAANIAVMAGDADGARGR